MDEALKRKGATILRIRFRDLKVRLKLMVLHNLFFLVLAASVYFSLVPLFVNKIANARQRESLLATQMFGDDRPLPRLPGLEVYEYREGEAAELNLSPVVKEWLDEHPGSIWQDPNSVDSLYRKNPRTGLYRKLRLPSQFYDDLARHAKINLALALSLVYVLAVLAMELFILPRYIYRPLTRMLEADQATQAGDHDNEYIAESNISGDEIGQIMRSRNATVHELRRHEEELLRKNDLLERQDRLASLGMLSASVAHELNTPLSVLHGSIEKLQETVPQLQAQDRLARMLRVTQRLRRISEGLIDFARVRKEELGPVDVRAVIEESWGLVAIDEKAGEVHFHNRVPEDVRVSGNADRLVQVFVNLLRNSMCALQPGGNITVESHCVTQDGRSLVSISVEDDGPGIPADVLPNIFEAFVTTRLDSRGTGLGLTVAEGIVSQHGGTIQASNRPGGGARLEVRLPAA